MTDAYRTLVVFNPKSSGGSTGRRRQAIEAAIRGAVGTFDLAETTGPGHATELSRQALKDGFEMVVAVGGDGTIHEVVNGFFDGDQTVVPQPILGLVPSGTGGDYRKTWGLSNDAEAAARRLGGRDARVVDAGRITWTEDGERRSRYFANIATFGLGGHTSKMANRQTKMFGGRVSFFVAGVRALLGWRNQPVSLVTDGGPARAAELTVAACCIGRACGGGMHFAPNADPSDGLFDIVSLEGLSRLEMAGMTSLYSGKHLSHPKVAFWQGRRVVADGTPECLIEADGEVFGSLPATFEIVPAAFRVKV